MQHEYLRFMVALSVVCLSRARLTRNDNDPGTVLLRAVFGPLMSDRAAIAVRDGSRPDDADPALEALKAELAYFAASYPPPDAAPVLDMSLRTPAAAVPRFEHVYDYFRDRFRENTEYRDATDAALDEAKTIKDSLEKLLELPEWMKRMLRVLNELLKIV